MEGNFAEIVREHQNMVYSIAYHFLHDRGAAEELAQDTFLQLYQNLATMDSPDHVKFWLRRVTSHRCIDYSRRRGVRSRVGLDQAPEPSTPAPSADPLLAEKLRKLVASLPEKQRMVVVLRFQEEMEPDEIAEILNIPVGTVKSQLQRALAVLRDKATRRLGEVRV